MTKRPHAWTAGAVFVMKPNLQEDG